ncbi:hypothetical protein [Sorangium sp. So ce341]
MSSARTNVAVAVLMKLAGVLGAPPGALFRRRELPEVERGRPKEA